LLSDNIDFLYHFQAPATSPQVDVPVNWTYQLSRADGTMPQEGTTANANVLLRLFSDLAKGTEYRGRVAGSNSRGLGAFSEFVVTETLVDRKFCRAF